MITIEERININNLLLNNSIMIPKRCILLEYNIIQQILDSFTEEFKNDEGREEEVEKEKQVDAEATKEISEQSP